MLAEPFIYVTGELSVFRKYIIVLWSWGIALVSINGESYLLYAIVATIIKIMQSDETKLISFEIRV